MTYFRQDGYSSCEIAGAIAEAAIHDLRVNLFSFSGFPQIAVADPVGDVFSVTLSWNWQNDVSVSFELTRSEAKSAVKKFKSGKGHDELIFDRVQAALAELEGASRQSR